jgi:hypothetical protein
LLGAELGEDSEDEGTAAELEAKVLEEIGLDGHTVPHPLCDTHCIAYSIGCQEFYSKKAAGFGKW